jgi:two-component system nitrate/nitrite response regulator NarL
MAGSQPARQTSVFVTSELVLVAEAVGEALAVRGFDTTTTDWLAAPANGKRPGLAPDVGPLTGRRVGLLISDLDSWDGLWAAWLLITQVPLPWVVLTSAPQGPSWGAALDAGARLVLPSSTGLERLCRVIGDVALGTMQTLSAEQEELVESWARLLERREEISQQVASLTPREREVLTMLHSGERIARIAQLLGVSPVTVRSQVKAVLRKLDVNSQLGAVAALDDLLALEPWG